MLDKHLRSSWFPDLRQNDAAGALKGLNLLVTALSWIFFLWRAIELFRPDSSLLQLYSSDSAIPLLMVDAPCATPFCLYYLGQDRFGAWPFLFAHWLGRAMHFTWSPERLSIWLIFFTFSAAWPLRSLVGKRDFIVPVYAGIVLLDRALQLNLLTIEGVYGWQAPALIWTWWFLRRLSLSDRPGWWLASACLGGWLATWSSPLSGPLLALLALVEFGFARLQTSHQAHWKRLVLLVVPSAFALTAEALLRRWFYRYTTVNFHTTYATVVRVDRGHLFENAKSLWSVLAQSRLWLFHLATSLAGAWFVATWILRLKQRKSPADSKDCWRAVAIGCAIICIATFCIMAALSHVRDNDHHPRYLVLVHLFGGLGAVAALAALIPQRQSSIAASNLFSIGLTGALSLALGLALPSAKSNPAYRDLKEAANWLADRTNPIVLGGYWGSYVFAGLAVPKRVVPIPIEEDYQRTPWTSALIHQSPELFVSAYWTDRFGPSDHPDRWVSDRGEFLERGQTPAFQSGIVSFWVYRNQTRRALSISSTFAPSHWNPCGREPLSLSFGPVAGPEVVYWFRSAEGPTLELTARTPSGLELRPREIERGARMVSYRFAASQPISRVIVQPARACEKCQLKSLAVLER